MSQTMPTYGQSESVPQNGAQAPSSRHVPLVHPNAGHSPASHAGMHTAPAGEATQKTPSPVHPPSARHGPHGAPGSAVPSHTIGGVPSVSSTAPDESVASAIVVPVLDESSPVDGAPPSLDPGATSVVSSLTGGQTSPMMVDVSPKSRGMQGPHAVRSARVRME